MKKAIIRTGAKQYVVTVGQVLVVELLNTDDKTVTWQPLLVIDDKKTKVGKPLIKDSIVKAEVLEASFKEDKIISIRYKAKKRLHKRRGHRQQKTLVKIVEIT